MPPAAPVTIAARHVGLPAIAPGPYCEARTRVNAPIQFWVSRAADPCGTDEIALLLVQTNLSIPSVCRFSLDRAPRKNRAYCSAALVGAPFGPLSAVGKRGLLMLP